MFLNCINNFNKVFRQLINTGGYCNNCSKIKHQNNIIESVKIKYGVENVFQLNNIKDKIVKTNILKFGFSNPNQNKDIRQKTKNTCLIKYGTDNPLKKSIVRDKIKQYYLTNFGVEYCSQIPEVAEKAHTNSFKSKTYICPSGKEIICQGYEPLALDKLIKEENIDENDVVTGCSNVPTIWYNDDNGKKHRHYVDIYIPSQNRCIEVKSTWTAEKKKDNIYLKQDAAKELGYNYELWIYNAKKELVECYK